MTTIHNADIFIISPDTQNTNFVLLFRNLSPNDLFDTKFSIHSTNSKSSNWVEAQLFRIDLFPWCASDILADIMEKLSSSVIRPVIHHTVSLEDACDTLQHQFSQHKVGKIVVRMWTKGSVQSGAHLLGRRTWCWKASVKCEMFS